MEAKLRLMLFDPRESLLHNTDVPAGGVEGEILIKEEFEFF